MQTYYLLESKIRRHVCHINKYLNTSYQVCLSSSIPKSFMISINQLALVWPTLESRELVGGAVSSRRVCRLVLAVPWPGWARGSPLPMFPRDCTLTMPVTGAFRGPQSSGAARKLLRAKGHWCFVFFSIGVVGGDGSRRRSWGICTEVSRELCVFSVFWEDFGAKCRASCCSGVFELYPRVVTCCYA
jgi:hypothetical protein